MPEWTVEEGQAGTRADVFLAAAMGVSRGEAQRLLEGGAARVNAAHAKPSLKLRAGDRVEAERPAPVETAILAEDIPLAVVYEDADVLVIDKPRGMVVHPAPGHAGGTLVNAALAHADDLSGIGGERRPGIVHRLDKDTSGVMVVAKTTDALKNLLQQFRRREVEKVYLALVDGAPPSPTGQVEAPLARSPRHRKRIAVVQAPGSRLAVTRFQTRERFPLHSLLELRPITGRTHQIRVHLQFLGCPVVGDRVYGRRQPTLPVARQQLHAWQLTFRSPGESQPRTFEAVVPTDLLEAIELARRP